MKMHFISLVFLNEGNITISNFFILTSLLSKFPKFISKYASIEYQDAKPSQTKSAEFEYKAKF